MLIAHISDIHLGYSQFNLEEREEDIYNAFAQAIDISIKEGVKLIILTGDIFNTPKPEGGAIVKLGDQLKRLKEYGIRVYFVLGDHDLSRVRGVPVPFAFHNLDFATYLGNGKLHEFNNILLVGFDKHRASEIDELIGKLKNVDEQVKKFNGHRILVLHQGLIDFNKYAGEINANDLPTNFTYYAMGHLHDRYKKRFDHLGGPLVYPGSIEVTSSEGIKETEKGFYIVDLSAKEPVPQWHKLDIRSQIEMQVKYDELDVKLDEFAKTIKDLSRKPVVHFKIFGKDIDSKNVESILSKITNLVLYYKWDPIEESISQTSSEEKTQDIDSELFELAKKELGNEELARFAINELLPLLQSGNTQEAVSVVWQTYEKFKGDRYAGENSTR
ncbi:MAG: metallophosphoesterase [Thaumarchaeota archaeon]|nr:metallophosphoesterase [Nitrososphaerota archaeon]|tara:strand:+ start:115 stop:1272 length:1158 start_codon:yes stop_codon:yes gene_type:complete